MAILRHAFDSSDQWLPALSQNDRGNKLPFKGCVFNVNKSQK